MPAAPFPAGMSRRLRRCLTSRWCSLTAIRRFPIRPSWRNRRPRPDGSRSLSPKRRLCPPTCWPLWWAIWCRWRLMPPTGRGWASGLRRARNRRRLSLWILRSSCWVISTITSAFPIPYPSWTISPSPTSPPGRWKIGAASPTAKRRCWWTRKTPRPAPASGWPRWWPTKWRICGSAIW